MFGDSSSRVRLRGYCSAGFTLVELIIAIVLIGMLAAVGAKMIASGFSTTRMINADNASTEQARYVMERLVRETREIKYSDSSGNYCITTMTATNLIFSKTPQGVDYNPSCGASDTITVTINQSGTDLTLGYNPGVTSATLGDQVSGFTLSYLNIDGTATTSTSAVKFIVIAVARTDPISGQTISQRTRVALRNGR